MPVRRKRESMTDTAVPPEIPDLPTTTSLPERVVSAVEGYIDAKRDVESVRRWADQTEDDCGGIWLSIREEEVRSANALVHTKAQLIATLTELIDTISRR